MDYCNRCQKIIKYDLDFKICKNCDKYYCNECGNNMLRYIEQTNITYKYLLNKCFSCFIVKVNDN